jgi:BirA family biotin operon repressor/biotin-[acetyl-CoA-carboxylase] ligase
MSADSSVGLIGETLQSHYERSLIGRKVVVLEETTSTNDAVLCLARTGAPEGLVVFAEHQTVGRGQHGKRWESTSRKGLWFSILLEPKLDLDQTSKLTAWAAETVANAVHSEFGLPAKTKPVNDVCVYGKKLAGVLVEMRARANAKHLAIAGIGINVNHSALDFPEHLRSQATSIALVLGRVVDRQIFAGTVLDELDRSYRARFTV